MNLTDQIQTPTKSNGSTANHDHEDPSVSEAGLELADRLLAGVEEVLTRLKTEMPAQAANSNGSAAHG